MTEIGQRLKGRYLISDVYGGGGFSLTYLAQDIHLPDRPVCVVKQLKILGDDSQHVEKAREFFFNEAKILRQLGKAHSQIPELLAYFTDNDSGNFYIVQEFVPGKTLKQILDGGTKLSETEVIYILKETLEILEFVHSYNVIHLDIKPSNLILRDSDYKITLIDFGSVKQARTQLATETSLTPQTTTLGTPGYMPCEQSFGRPKLSSDFYALGMVAIQALTGIHPKELEEDLSSGEILWQERASLGHELKAILQKMVRYHFKQRYQSAAEILQDIANLQPLYKIDLSTCPKPLQALVELNRQPLPSFAKRTRSNISDAELVRISQPTVVASDNDARGGLNPMDTSDYPPPPSLRQQKDIDPRKLSIDLARQQNLSIWRKSQDRASAAIRSTCNLYVSSAERLRAMLAGIDVKPKVFLVGTSTILFGMLASLAAFHVVDRQVLRSEEREILKESRRLATENLEEAIQKAREIPPQSPFYGTATAYIQSLLAEQQLEQDRDVLASARTLASTNREAAIETISKITTESSLFEEAQLDRLVWLSELLESHLTSSSQTLAALDPQIDIQLDEIFLQYDDSSDAKLASEEGIGRVAIATMSVLRSKYTDFRRLTIYPSGNGLQGTIETDLWGSYENGEITFEQLLERVHVVERGHSTSDRLSVSKQL